MSIASIDFKVHHHNHFDNVFSQHPYGACYRTLRWNIPIYWPEHSLQSIGAGGELYEILNYNSSCSEKGHLMMNGIYIIKTFCGVWLDWRNLYYFGQANKGMEKLAKFTVISFPPGKAVVSEDICQVSRSLICVRVQSLVQIYFTHWQNRYLLWLIDRWTTLALFSVEVQCI